ncbi:MAG: hypothetical protein HY862_09415 [Chloroflexi bacterium]|nr:hypothetical protein [Chloroflexota bacterium]
MDVPINARPTREVSGLRLNISVEMVAYLALLLIAGALRLLSLDHAPLSNREAHEALSALRLVNSHVPGDAVVADSPMMAFVNMLLFIFLGNADSVARLGTAIMGTLLVLGPLLWRGFLGRVTALGFAFLLAFSPVAMAASRTMGAATWTMAAVFIGGWCLWQYIQTRTKAYAISATMAASAILLLTETTGIITAIGLLCGLALALWSSRNLIAEPDQKTPAETLKEISKSWPWIEGVMGALALVLVVGTALFFAPSGLTATGNTISQFIEGISQRTSGVPYPYAFIVSLRYDLGLVLFGLVGLYFALSEGNFLTRFFAGWFIWAIIAAILYPGATADAALWITMPAAGLGAFIITRMAHSAQAGYWVVPDWGIPAHAVGVALLLTALSVNGLVVGRVLQREAFPSSYYKPINPTATDKNQGALTSAARIGTFYDPQSSLSTFPLYVTVQSTSLVVQLWRIDDNIEPQMSVLDENNQVIYGPFTYPKKGGKGIVERLDLPKGNYFLNVTPSADSINERGQYLVMTYPADYKERDSFYLDIPYILAIFRVLQANPPLPVTAPLVLLFAMLLLIILFFLVGSLWGSRAAWRGLGFGMLVYFSLYGIGLGWQASVTFADDPRELWHIRDTAVDYDSMVDTLKFMSRQENGEEYRMDITVQAPDDGALAWALRNFERTQFVEGVGIEINTAAVIAPPTPEGQRLDLGADYVGQDVVLDRHYEFNWLSWVDMLGWLTLRETRYPTVPDEQVMLWVRNDVYGVKQVPPSQ